jgi:hypothetical protein
MGTRGTQLGGDQDGPLDHAPGDCAPAAGPGRGHYLAGRQAGGPWRPDSSLPRCRASGRI